MCDWFCCWLMVQISIRNDLCVPTCIIFILKIYSISNILCLIWKVRVFEWHESEFWEGVEAVMIFNRQPFCHISHEFIWVKTIYRRFFHRSRKKKRSNIRTENDDDELFSVSCDWWRKYIRVEHSKILWEESSTVSHLYWTSIREAFIQCFYVLVILLCRFSMLHAFLHCQGDKIVDRRWLPNVTATKIVHNACCDVQLIPSQDPSVTTWT